MPNESSSLVDPGGRRQGRVPPWGPNSFIFMQSSARNLQNKRSIGVGAPLRKIMDPPLEFMFIISLILNRMPEAVMMCCVQLFKGGNPFLAQPFAKETVLSQSVVSVTRFCILWI